MKSDTELACFLLDLRLWKSASESAFLTARGRALHHHSVRAEESQGRKQQLPGARGDGTASWREDAERRGLGWCARCNHCLKIEKGAAPHRSLVHRCHRFELNAGSHRIPMKGVQK
ncbi:hypothetical protein ANANG_G00125430, partial [Anguilla anguilla]